MTKSPLFIVDAFTDSAFRGNPAAICLLDTPRQDQWMQSVAAEMNLSETAFVSPGDDNDFQLRWFTPKIEVDLCGHATLAAAHVLWEEGLVAADASIAFKTRSGVLSCNREQSLIQMDFPATPANCDNDVPNDLAESLQAALCGEARVVGRTRFDILLTVESEDKLRSLSPNFQALGEIASRGVIVTSPSADPTRDFASRFFAPAAGVNEDPVTGSAHCCLGPYWSGVLGKDDLVGYQASARGGIVHVKVLSDRVTLGGHAVTVVRGDLLA